MALFSKKRKSATHQARIHFAQPMPPQTRHGIEDGIVGELLPGIGATGKVVGGGTGLVDGEPFGADIELDIETTDPGKVAGALAAVNESNGAARGSYLEMDGVRFPFGVSEHVLLRMRLGERELADPPMVVKALQAALGDGEIAWHDGTYYIESGPVLMFSGPDAAAILAALRAEIARQPDLADAELVSVTAGAAEGPEAT